MEIDASIQGLGSVLLQLQDNGKPHPIAYTSHALSSGERNYGVTKLEMLAVVWAVIHFRACLYVPTSPFIPTISSEECLVGFSCDRNE